MKLEYKDSLLVFNSLALGFRQAIHMHSVRTRATMQRFAPEMLSQEIEKAEREENIIFRKELNKISRKVFAKYTKLPKKKPEDEKNK